MVTSIGIDNFKFGDAKETGKHSFFLEIECEGGGERAGIPLLIANGASTGKTLVVFAAVHGDELEGVQAIQDVFRQLDTNEMHGRMIAVPVANLPAYLAVSRNSPVDGLNLARTFPGKKDGFLTERIAHYLAELIIPEADLFLDLHSSGVRSLMPTMVGYDASDTESGNVSAEAALTFGTPIIWGHKDIGPGRSICSAASKGIPWLYVESPNGARVSETDLPYYANGILNLLGHLKIIFRKLRPVPPRYSLIGSGDVDTTQTARVSGFFVRFINLMDRVEKGQPVGEIRDLFGNHVEDVHAEHSGFVAMLRSTPVLTKGDPIILIAQERLAV